MNRRKLLQSAAAVTAAASATLTRSVAAEKESFQIIDSNVSLFRWPFRRLPLDEPNRLVEKMGDLGISQAFAGSFEGIFHRDIRSANRRLSGACRSQPHGQLVPVGSINPELPDWKDDLLHCKALSMPGIRLHPNYHGYTLKDASFREVLEFATDMNFFIQLAVALEDPRTQSAKLQVSDVDLAPLPGILKRLPDTRVQLLNWRPRGAVLETLAETPNVSFDTARIESTDGVATLLKAVPHERVLFGTHAPFLIPEAALIRVHESNLPENQLRAVLQTSAERIKYG